MPRLIDLTGQRFGKWTVLEYADDEKYKSSWLCKCECGKTKIVLGNNLKRGKTISCGCHRSEVLKEIKTTHGDRRTRLYRTWSKMRERCYKKYSKNFPDYGGRGISICNAWKYSYESFREWALSNGYDDNLTIDRINNDGNYEPENCRWVTSKVQGNNKRNNHPITINGVTKNLGEWCEFYGINRKTVQSRIVYGWEENESLFMPPKKQKECRK